MDIEEKLYEFVANEISSGLVRAGLWTKALARSGYNETAAKALYIEYRVESLKNELESQRPNIKPFSAIEAYQTDLARKRENLVKKWRENEEAEEIEKYERWKKAEQAAAKYLNYPIPAELYAMKNNISLNEVNNLIGKAVLKGANVAGELFVEDVPLPQLFP